MKTQYFRKKFYVRVSIVIFLALAFICAIYMSFIFYDRGLMLKEYEQQLLTGQKNKMKADIDSTILAVENVRSGLVDVYAQEAIRLKDSLRELTAEVKTEQELNNLIGSISKDLPYATIYTYIRPEGTLNTFSSGNYLYIEHNVLEEDFRARVKQNEINDAFWLDDFYLELGIYYEDSAIDTLVKETFCQVIQNNIFERQEYLWINQIVSYSGGNDFTYQVVYPFFAEEMEEPSEESTPNAFEMEAVRRAGEVFFSFEMEQLNSPVLKAGQYLAYAKSYPNFNWIIGTAISYDEIRQKFLEGSSSIDEQVRAQSFLPILALVTIFPLFLAFIYMAESRYFAMINEYTQKLENSKRVYENRIGELRKDSDRDVVTNLYNRRYIVNMLAKQFELSKQSAKNYSVILSDIDFFKKVNDIYGHDAGDYVLREVSSVMQNALRSDDCLARYGGEEFLILLTSEGVLNNEILSAISEKLRRCVEGNTISYAGNEINVTMSFGVSSFYITDETYMDAVRRADAAMYESKQTGRNRVTIRDDE